MVTVQYAMAAITGQLEMTQRRLQSGLGNGPKASGLNAGSLNPAPQASALLRHALTSRIAAPH